MSNLQGEEKKPNKALKIISKNMILLGFVILCAVIGSLSSNFFTVTNWLNILVQCSIVGIIAVGMTFVIITGGIDLSVGSMLAFSAIVSGMMLKNGASIPVVILVALIIGTAIGFANGFFITKFNVPAFIVTLATMSIFRGLTLVVSDGKNQALSISKSASPDLFSKLTAFSKIGDKLGPVPIPIIIMIIIFLIGYYVLQYTTFGRNLYAIGGNREATRFSGINIGKIELLAYTITGLLCALSGVVLNARLGAALPNAGVGYEMDAIGAVVIGGASLAGGEGTISGTILGVLIIGVLNNGLNLMNVNPFYQQVVKGAVILVAVLVDQLKRKK
ncbi:ribose ABC transporter permease [Clostridium botulinum]|uniref:Ribose ABC transporter permease n=2 Tax=Clostridium botulinum TaxID=1491 RepID=A0A846I4P2_CLOBO|nr:ribose ABC transporter permease [Clostridium botulinum]AJD27413.1 branched-chain amino acid transport system / permease component family protein [Clostridium botulinum CDC_297]ACQ51725.1 ribose transport system permease protein RbsC [Clostridium botulinum Ba4 str. 657]AJE09344.1 branched-chain amino acid transport system / permease component family protein [Clostridium botulinum CDC_1436]APU60150.1 branched-chain amino acid transport system / permease component family protein [Clostridium bo